MIEHRVEIADAHAHLFRVTLRLPGPFRVWHGSVPDVPPARRQALYVETRGRTATLVDEWTCGPPGAAASAQGATAARAMGGARGETQSSLSTIRMEPNE